MRTVKPAFSWSRITADLAGYIERGSRPADTDHPFLQESMRRIGPAAVAQPAGTRVGTLVRKARLVPDAKLAGAPRTKSALAKELFELAAHAQQKGWSAEALLRAEAQNQERALRRREARG